MKYTTKTITAFCLACFLAVRVSAAREEAFMIRDLRPLGMGGAYTAVADDGGAFFYNPAGVAVAEKTQMTILQLGLTIGDDLKDGYDWYKDNQDDIDKMDDLKTSDPAKWADLMGNVINKISKLRIVAAVDAPQFSLVAPNHKLAYGGGLFGQANVLLNVNPGILLPTVDIHGRADIVAPVAFGMRFMGDRLALGVSPKLLKRIRVDETRMTFLEMEDFDVTEQTGNGFGIDMGAIYKLTDKINVGAAWKDASLPLLGGTEIKYGAEWTEPKSTSTTPLPIPGYTARIPSSLNVGVSYRMNKLLLFSFDVNDIWHSKNKVVWGTTLWPKIHAGCELNLFNFLRGRLGINQGYPTFGFDLNLWLFHIEYARWADERGFYAGDLAEWQHKLAITMRYSWGGKKEEPVKEEKPQEEVKAEIPDSEKINIAVTDFEARAPLSRSETAFISDFVRGDLVTNGRFNVVEKNSMDKILAEQGFQNSGCSSADCAVAMGKILNVKTIIVGSCGKLLNKYIVTLNAVEVESSKIVYSDNISVDNPDDLRDSVAGLVDKYAESIK
ncbi:MAG: conjugal transfer protein TraF [Elusimicrobiota bacterium]|nr:conjugal transfer protein TraF [Elusimicrobiota bacterium]